VLVESLQVQRGQFCQWDAADLRLNVVLEEALAGFEGGRSEFYSGVVLHPDFQPCSHRVGLGSPVVDADVFLDSFFQFFLDFGLRLAEDILDNCFPGFGIVSNGISALPAPIFSLANVTLAVRSSLWHGTNSFRQRTIP